MSLLRNIETHVRVMAERDMLALGEKSVDFGPRGAQLPFNGQFKSFTRVHKEKDNNSFFNNALRKIASSAAAGQHHTVLIFGPPNSGRSQTMFDVQDAGVVHLTAKALLEIPDATIHFSAFNVRDQLLLDSCTDQEVGTVDLPAPIGPFPTSTVRLLEKASDAVVVPRDKRAETSSFVMFHVYRQVTAPGSARRDAFATITFVDVCSFNDTLPSDLHKLSATVDRLLQGVDPQFNACRLTQLLEPSFKGGRTMTAVCAITGAKNNSVAACFALEFAERLGRIGQVAPLCQLIPPRWVEDLPKGFEVMEHERITTLQAEYARGVATVYSLLQELLAQKHKETRTDFKNDSAFESSRRRLAEGLRQRLEAIEAAAANDGNSQSLMQELQSESRRFRAAAEDLERKNAQALRRVAASEQTLRQETAELDEFVATANLQLSRLDSEQQVSDRRLADVHTSIRVRQEAVQQADREAEAALDRMRRAGLFANRNNALAKLESKRRRLESQLQDLSEKAATMFNAATQDRQRKSMASRATHAEAKQAITRSVDPNNFMSPKRASASPLQSRGVGKKSRSRTVRHQSSVGGLL